MIVKTMLVSRSNSVDVSTSVSYRYRNNSRRACFANEPDDDSANQYANPHEALLGDLEDECARIVRRLDSISKGTDIFIRQDEHCFQSARRTRELRNTEP